MRIQDSGRNEMQGIPIAVDNDRVARVVSALIANDVIGFLREEIGDFALSFVTPLDANESGCRHRTRS